jgi:hypothetical protein
MRVTVDPRTSDLVRARMARFRHPLSRIEELAGELEVLPLWIDWSVFVAIRPDGALVVVNHEAPAPDPQPAKDLTFIAIALVEAAANYPELAHLRPPRPSGRSCATCGGAGTVSVGRGNVVLHCVCGGLGWKPERPEELGLEADDDAPD